jgi:transposase
VADPSASTPHDCKTRNVLERTFNKLKNWRGLTRRYDKRPVVDGGGSRPRPHVHLPLPAPACVNTRSR